MAATTNDRLTPGPARVAATVPGKMKIPVPITAPTPRDIKSTALIVLANLISLPR